MEEDDDDDDSDHDNDDDSDDDDDHTKLLASKLHSTSACLSTARSSVQAGIVTGSLNYPHHLPYKISCFKVSSQIPLLSLSAGPGDSACDSQGPGEPAADGGGQAQAGPREGEQEEEEEEEEGGHGAQYEQEEQGGTRITRRR